MSKNQRATFTKTEFENGGKAKTVYSFSLEKAHWAFGILASIAAIVGVLVVLRGAVYASVQDVAGAEFKNQLQVFHSTAQPAIRALIDERIEDAATGYVAAEAADDHLVELTHAQAIADVAVALARLDERLGAIERRLNALEPNP